MTAEQQCIGLRGDDSTAVRLAAMGRRSSLEFLPGQLTRQHCRSARSSLFASAWDGERRSVVTELSAQTTEFENEFQFRIGNAIFHCE